jgi:PPOX class probable F420-dependent enzyme
MIDLSTEFGARVARRLEQELIIWLTTVRIDGTPQPSPVWFLWADQSLLIYSQPNKQKLRNIAQNPKVALNFNSDASGGDIAVINGTAQIDSQAPPADRIRAYLDKYRQEIADLGSTPDGFAQSYSVAIRVTPVGLRGF